MIINGGAGTIDDIEEIYNIKGVDGLALGSILHYSFVKTQPFSVEQYQKEGNIDFIKQSSKYNKFGNESIKSIKSSLKKQGFECRI